jgi:hypothetical protein
LQISREQRWPVIGRVNLIVDAAPWKLRTCARAVNVSKTGICVRLDDPKQMKKQLVQLDLLPLIREGETFGLQLENEQPEARAQATKVTLIRKQKSGDSYILGFKFINPPSEVSDLIENLASEDHDHQQPGFLF